MINETTPIWQLTVGEFKELISQGKETKADPVTKYMNDEFTYGIAGLAELIGASKTTAQKLKSSGILDPAITQIGRQIIINKKQTIEILKNKKP